MSPARTLLNLLIIVAGPLIPIYIFRQMEASELGGMVFLLFLAAATAAVSAALHLILKKPLLAFFASMAISFIGYVLLLLAFILLGTQGLERSEAIAWLPISIAFLLVYTFPMALLVSYGTGRIVRDGRATRSSTPNLPGVLVNLHFRQSCAVA